MNRDVPGGSRHGVPDGSRAGAVARSRDGPSVAPSAPPPSPALSWLGAGEGMEARRTASALRSRARPARVPRPKRRAAAQATPKGSRRALGSSSAVRVSRRGGARLHRPCRELRQVRHRALPEVRLRWEAGLRSGPATWQRREVAERLPDRRGRGAKGGGQRLGRTGRRSVRWHRQGGDSRPRLRLTTTIESIRLARSHIPVRAVTVGASAEALSSPPGHDRAVARAIVEVDQDQLLPGPEREPPGHDRDRLGRSRQRRALVCVRVRVVVEPIVLVVAVDAGSAGRAAPEGR